MPINDNQVGPTTSIFPVFELPEQMEMFSPEEYHTNPSTLIPHLDAGKGVTMRPRLGDDVPLLPPPELDVDEIVVVEREFDGNGNVTKETRTISRPRKLPKPDRPFLPRRDPAPVAPYTPWVVPQPAPFKPGPYTSPPSHPWPTVTYPLYGPNYAGYISSGPHPVTYNENWHQA